MVPGSAEGGDDFISRGDVPDHAASEALGRLPCEVDRPSHHFPRREAFTRDLQSPRYRWEAGEIEIPRMSAGVPCLIGRPE